RKGRSATARWSAAGGEARRPAAPASGGAATGRKRRSSRLRSHPMDGPAAKMKRGDGRLPIAGRAATNAARRPGRRHVAEDYQMPKGELMAGKRGIITGVANHQSIAWGIASQLAAQGAEMAFLHLPGMERRVEPLAESIGVKVLAPVDVTDDAAMDAAFGVVEKAFGTIDFFVHAIAFAPKDQISGSFVENASRDGFLRALNISAFSFVDCARRAAAL